MSGLVTAIENLVTIDIITKDNYEVAIVGNKANLLFKFMPE